MQNTFGSTAFRVFDKIIVAILVLVTIIFVAAAVIRKPEKVVDTDEITRLKGVVMATQKRSTHTVSPLTQDYATATVGAFRPDLQGYKMQRGIDFGKPHLYPKQVFTRKEAPQRPRDVRVKPEHVGAEIRVVDGTAVKAVWSQGKNKKDIVLLTPITPVDTPEPVSTDVQLIKRGGTVAVIPVLVNPKEVRDPEIEPPQLTVAHRQRKVKLVLTRSGTRDAIVEQYTIFKGESPNALEPFIRISVPPPVGPDADGEVTVVRVADGKPAGAIKAVPPRFEFMDSDVDGGVRYWYAADAAGKDTRKKREPLKSKMSKPVVVNVPEAFKIKFYTLSPDHVMVVVSVMHAPPDGAALQHVEYTFRRGVVRGQAVGWKVARVKLPGRRGVVRNVDFSTGYQILDIVNGERRVNKVRPAGGGAVREDEERRQKLLLIDERGRIKVLWPSPRGPR